MNRPPDPTVPGLVRSDGGVEVGTPPLPVPGWLLVELLPMVRAWRDEHVRMGATAKVAKAEPFLARWEFLALLERERFADESVGGATVGRPARLTHEETGAISATEAASRLGCTPQWVGELCRRRELRGHKVGRVWQVDPASVGAYLERRDVA